MPSTIVTSTYRYKRPPRKRKAVPLEGPAIVTISGEKRVAKAEQAAVTPRSAIVTARRPGARSSVEDMAPEEHRRRGEAATELWRELVRRATGNN